VGVPTRQAPQERSATRRGIREHALDVTLRCFVDSVGADNGAIVVRDPGGTRMLSYWAATDRELSISWTSETLLGRAFGSTDALVEQRTNGSRGATSAVAAPFAYGVGHAGVLYAGFSAPPELDRGRLTRTASSYAGLAGLCLDRSPVLAATLCAPKVDALTGCLSYAGLTEAFKDELERSRRHGHRLSCCFVDLDGFKRVNDELGHLEGNRVLSAVGEALRRTARRYDVVARFGGDEFVVLLPETGARAARAIASRLRASSLEAIASTGASTLEISVGVAEWDGESGPAELLNAADRALGEAKRSGGGRVTEAPSRGRAGLVALTKRLFHPGRAGRRRAAG
jgi:diguanylate cyclase (GGDEF)-like protein